MLRQYPYVIISLWRRLTLCLGLILLLSFTVNAQHFYFEGKRKKQTISFKLVKNLIIIPLYINNKGPFNFLLDTGVGAMIITNPNIIDSLDFKSMRKIKVTGLGLQEVDAFITHNLNAKIGLSKIKNIPTTILKEDFFNLSGYLGMNIEGIIGSTFFESFVVDIRYSSNKIKFYIPDYEPSSNSAKIPIYIQNSKPYVDAELILPNGETISSRLLIDTGASHALSLESLNKSSFPLPDPSIQANLGMSLSGEISGHLARVKNFKLGNYPFKEVIAGFPDFKYIANKLEGDRNGNLGSDLLRKFNILINYQDRYMALKPNQYFSKPFEYDMVGATIYLNKDLNRIFIAEVDPNSPAEKAGLLRDDEIIGVNLKNAISYSLNDLNEMFRAGEGKKIILEVIRAGKPQFILVSLKKRI